MNNQPFDMSEFCGQKAVELFENAAILRALEALAFENDNLEDGDQCLTEVQLLARVCRRNIEAIASAIGDAPAIAQRAAAAV